ASLLRLLRRQAIPVVLYGLIGNAKYGGGNLDFVDVSKRREDRFALVEARLVNAKLALAAVTHENELAIHVRDFNFALSIQHEKHLACLYVCQIDAAIAEGVHEKVGAFQAHAFANRLAGKVQCDALCQNGSSKLACTVQLDVDVVDKS